MLRTPSPTLGGEEHTPRRSTVLQTISRMEKLRFRYPNLSKNDVCAILDISVNTANRWIRQSHRNEDTCRRIGKAHSGRPSILSKYDINRAEAWLLKNGFGGRTASWEELVKELGFTCNARTLKRRMEQRGYRKRKAAQKKWLSETNIEARYHFCRQHRVTDLAEQLRYWRCVRFTDECHVAITAANTSWVIRKDGDRFRSDCMQRKKKREDSYFHLWAMVGHNFKSEL